MHLNIFDPVEREQKAQDYSSTRDRYREYEINRLMSVHRADFEEVEEAEEKFKIMAISTYSTAVVVSGIIGGIALFVVAWPIALCVFGTALCAGLITASIIRWSSLKECPDKSALMSQIETNADSYATKAASEFIYGE